MVTDKSGPNLVFALAVAVLGLTVVIFLCFNAKQPDREPAAAQEATRRQLPANHPNADVLNKLATLEQLISKEPQNPDYRTQAANLYYDLGQYDKAADFYQQSLDIHPQDPNVETDLASCFHYLGQEDKALEILDRVLQYSPGFPQAMFNKGIVLADGKKDVKAGIIIWEDLLRLDPSFPQRADLEQRIAQFRASMR